MGVVSFFREIHRRSALLSSVGWIQLAALVILIAVAQFDAAAILGINRWIKPAKFLASTTIYVWTIAWFLAYIPGGSRLVAWGSAAAMLIENSLIMMQAARGVTSHFNVATSFDAAVFAVMGSVILSNTVLLAWLLALFFRRHVELPSTCLWGIRLGLLLTICGSLEGFAMVARGAHTIGAPDGGAGLPIVNWSRNNGDLRAAHFFGIHSLQIIPLFGYVIRGARAWAVAVFAAAYSGVVALLLWLAFEGYALLPA